VISDIEPFDMDVPETMAISVIMLGELRAGVRLAPRASVRGRETL
jgi:hypothetical protein